jgi:hypothetical protein
MLRVLSLESDPAIRRDMLLPEYSGSMDKPNRACYLLLAGFYLGYASTLKIESMFL